MDDAAPAAPDATEPRVNGAEAATGPSGARGADGPHAADAATSANGGPAPDARVPAEAPPPGRPSPAPGHPPPAGAPTGQMVSAGCTAPQLRRFIKSRPYVPMHELRRRFGINGNDDDVTQVRLDACHVYVGLPGREGALLGELLRGGEIGYELSLDPRTPVVVGVYPMRPVPRG